MPVRVLIIDDQAVFRQAMRATVEWLAGFEVCAIAECGESSLEILPTARPDLVLMDIHTPGLDGFLITRRIRKQAAAVHQPVIILLSTYEADDYARLAESGADAYVPKIELEPKLMLSIWLTGSRP